MRNKFRQNNIQILLLTMVLPLGLPATALSQTLIVQAYAVKVRSSPALLGPSVGELKHGDNVQEVSRKGNFVKIKHRSLTGWIPVSAVTEEKRLALKKGDKVDSKDKALLGAAGLGVADLGGEMNPPKSAQGRRRLQDVIAATPENERELFKFQSDGELKQGRKGLFK